MRRMLRWQWRRTKTSPRGRHLVAFGVRLGYWPCLEAPFLQVAFGAYVLDVWHGLPSLKQVESGDR